MATIDPVIVQIQADISNLKKGLTDAEASLKGLDDNVKKAGGGFDALGGTLKKVGAVLGTTFAATQIFSFFKSAVQGAAEAEAGLTRLRSILLTTGGATEVQVAALEKQAEALSKVGFASKENIITTQSQLATFDLQGKTINKLTPAILDYVAAEKGATATTEDYKQMTNGLAQALQGNFAALTRVGFVLDEDTKKKISNGTESERAAAITEVLNSTYKDFNKTLADTPEGRMMKLKQEFDDLKQTIGEGLLPIISSFMNVINTRVFPVLEKAANAFKNLTTGLSGEGSVGDSFKKVGNTLKDFFMPIIKALVEAFNKIKKAFMDNKERIMDILNTFKELGQWVMNNIVPLFRTYLVTVFKATGTALSNAIKVIIPVAQFVVNTVKTLINGIVDVINLMIKGYNKVAGAFGKEQVDLISKIGEKTFGVTRGLVRMGEEAEKTKGKIKGVGDVWAGSADPAGGGKDKGKTESKIESLKKKLKDYYKSWDNAQRDAQDKFADAQERFNERIADAQERYKERVKDVEDRYNEQMAEAQERYNETVASAQERASEREIELRTNHAKKLIEINKRFTKQEADAKEQLEKKITELQENAQQKRLELRRSAAEKEASLVQQSVDRLRSAFASALGFDLKEEFEKGGGITGILDAIRTKLKEAANLQKNAAALAGKGYSQTFIEQILQAGPKIGNDMAKALLEATPETTAEMQALFGQLENVQDSGLNMLAKSMNEGGNLATRELREQYRNVADDLKTSLEEVDAQLKLSLDESQDAYSKAMAETAKLRQEAIDEAVASLNEALAENEKALKETLAKAEKALKDSQDKAKRDLDKSLMDAQETLQKSLIEAQKAFEKSVDDINKSMEKKLEDLKVKIAEAQAALAQLSSMSMAPMPSYTPFGYNPDGFTPNPYGYNATSANANYNYNNNITLNQQGFTDPNSTAMSIMAYIKYGMVVKVGTPIYTEHGTVIAE